MAFAPFRFLALLSSLALAGFSSEPSTPQTSRTIDGAGTDLWGSVERQAAPTIRGAWLRDSRFAMFVHWGFSSKLGGEWKGKTYYGISEWIMNRARIPAREYAEAAAEFNPAAFNAAEWVALARRAGMRHMMVTSKHHDGFAMFDSKVSDFTVVRATPFRRDPLAELAKECERDGMRLGFYYSQTQDWHEPDAVGNSWDNFPGKPDFGRYLAAKVTPQLMELLTNYGRVAAVWFDTPGPITRDQSKELVGLVHRLQPDCLVNSRIGNGLGDYDSLGDQEIPRLARAGLWESIDTTNDSWGFARNDINWKTPQEIVHRLIRVVSRGGTYMLNVGPDGDGRIPAECVRILEQVGYWVNRHERAIHGAAPSPFGSLPWGECTQSGDKLFLHVLHWPATGVLELPVLRTGIHTAKMGGEALGFQRNENGWVLRLPANPPAELVPVIEVTLSAPVEVDRSERVLGGLPNRLVALTAKIEGATVRKFRWMEKFGDWKHTESITDWTFPGAAATWQFKTTAPAEFTLEVEYSCSEEADLSDWRVIVDGREIKIPLIDTGERVRREGFGHSLIRLRTYSVGLIAFPAAGSHKISLVSNSARCATVKISALRLTPR